MSLLPKRAAQLRRQPPKVRDMSREDGVCLAWATIRGATQAAAAQASPLPPGTGIGGPIRGYLISKDGVRSLDTVLAGADLCAERAP
jgi:hypothetical protein